MIIEMYHHLEQPQNKTLSWKTRKQHTHTVDWFSLVLGVLNLITGWGDNKKNNSYSHTDHHVTCVIETSSQKHNPR